ncbi:hypothetical protein C6568_08960 [Melaminivora suipulveris]|uniref:LTXXQ motif family protein n=1 Tax=Melaminivora suipulveris TaxID=2109913 RepID=A0A2R3QC80_9BURK|nr:Spy/CpxP family protein refolding chaperone [Melaminivora suipulveris]AVO49378.1 hypothetical protein C6568_08960 [Melaminivora suipulveris]
MTRTTRSTLVAGACAALLALAGASAAVAQQPSSPAAAFANAAAGQSAQDGHAQWRSMTPEQRQQARQQRHAQKAAALKQKLAITPDQENAWSSFQQAMQPAGQARAHGQRQDWKQLTTPERIDRMRELRTQRMAEQDRRGDAIKAFYAALKPEQQKTFDAEGTRMMGGHFGNKKGGHHGGMRHGQHSGAQSAPAQQ